MASYLQGVTDYIPQIQPFVPDYNFYAQAQQMKTSKADAAREQLSTLYGSLLNAPLTREDNTATRDKLFKTVEQDIKKVSGLDLSLEQNVNTAKTLFDPILENKNMIKDMVWTKNFYDQGARSEGFKNCIDPAKCGGGWWEGGDRLLSYQKEAFKRATPDVALHMADAEFVPRQDVVKMSMDLAKAADLNVSKDEVTGQWITTTKNGPLISGTLESLFQGTLARDPKVKAYYKAEMELARKDFMFNNESAYGSLESAEQAYIDLIAPEIEKQDPHYVEQAEDKVKTTQAKVDMINAAAKDATPNKKSKLEQIRDDYVKLGEAYAATADETKQVAGTVQVAKNNKRYTGEQIDDILAYYALSKDIMGAAEIMAQKDMESKKTANPYGLEAVQQANKLAFEEVHQANAIILQNLRNAGKTGKTGITSNPAGLPGPKSAKVSYQMQMLLTPTQLAIVNQVPALRKLFSGPKWPSKAAIVTTVTHYGLPPSTATSLILNNANAFGAGNPNVNTNAFQPQSQTKPQVPPPSVPSGANKGTPGLPGVTGGLPGVTGNLPQNAVTPGTTPNAGTVNNPPVPQPVVQNPTVQNPAAVVQPTIIPINPILLPKKRNEGEALAEGRYVRAKPILLNPPELGTLESNFPETVTDILGGSGTEKEKDKIPVRGFTQLVNNRNAIDPSADQKVVIGTMLSAMQKAGEKGNVQAQEDYVNLLKNIAYTAGITEYDISDAPSTGKIMVGDMPIPDDMVDAVITKIDAAPTLQDQFNMVKQIRFNINKLPANRVDNIHTNLVEQIGKRDDEGNQILRAYLDDAYKDTKVATQNIGAKQAVWDHFQESYKDEIPKVIAAASAKSYYGPMWADAFESYFDETGSVVNAKTFTENMVAKGYDAYSAWSLYRGDVEDESDLPIVQSIERSKADETKKLNDPVRMDKVTLPYTYPLNEQEPLWKKQKAAPIYELASGKKGLFDQWKRAYSEFARPEGEKSWMATTGVGNTYSSGVQFKQVDPAESRSVGTEDVIGFLRDGLTYPTTRFAVGNFAENLPETDPAARGIAQMLHDDVINMKSGTGRPILVATFTGTAANDPNRQALNIKLNPLYANYYIEAKKKSLGVSSLGENDFTGEVLNNGITVYIDKDYANNPYSKGIIKTPVEILLDYRKELPFDDQPKYVRDFKLKFDQDSMQYVASGYLRAGYNEDGSEYWDPYRKTFPYTKNVNGVVAAVDAIIANTIQDVKHIDQEYTAQNSK